MGMDNASDCDASADTGNEWDNASSHGDSDYCEVLQIPPSWANRPIKIEVDIVCSIKCCPPPFGIPKPMNKNRVILRVIRLLALTSLHG